MLPSPRGSCPVRQDGGNRGFRAKTGHRDRAKSTAASHNHTLSDRSPELPARSLAPLSADLYAATVHILPTKRVDGREGGLNRDRAIGPDGRRSDLLEAEANVVEVATARSSAESLSAIRREDRCKAWSGPTSRPAGDCLILDEGESSGAGSRSRPAVGRCAGLCHTRGEASSRAFRTPSAGRSAVQPAFLAAWAPATAAFISFRQASKIFAVSTAVARGRTAEASKSTYNGLASAGLKSGLGVLN